MNLAVEKPSTGDFAAAKMFGNLSKGEVLGGFGLEEEAAVKRETGIDVGLS